MRVAIVGWALALFVSTGACAQQIGAGYNNDIANLYDGLVAKSGVKWVRAFIDIQRNYLTFDDPNPTLITGVLGDNITQVGDAVSGPGDNLAIAAVRKLIQLKSVKVKGEPVKVILTLKQNYKYACVPAPPPGPDPICAGVPNPGTPAAEDVRTAIHERLLADNLGKYLDILVMDNEPMFETLDTPESAETYGKLLNVLIADVAGLRATEHAKDPSGWNFQIFVGALNKPSSNPQSPILQTVIDQVKNNALVDGLDLHLHVGSTAEFDADLAFIRGTADVQKTLISTEFSLIGLWNSVAELSLVSKGRRAECPNAIVKDYLNTLMQRASAGDPIRADAFYKCIRAQSWYPDRWFRTLYGSLKKYDVAVATYGMQSPPANPVLLLGTNPALWVLNFVYNGTLFGMGEDGFYNTNPLVYPDFIDAVRKP